MSQKPTKHNTLIDFISYTAIGYIATFNTDWFSTKRIVDSLIVGLAATLLRIVIDPKVDKWKERLRKKRVDKRNALNSGKDLTD